MSEYINTKWSMQLAAIAILTINIHLDLFEATFGIIL